ncbi:hypothetical protein A3H10_03325 [Candidatus Uhrbacteria bacterium RIFCSPLOWO2_12_FULL_46_10]|nr:MAG: hypothetical protein A3H10_03325 [Candidatus Uhrbacteria bacterium RIFCSPLOWO2_12_FULL_46_10]
MAISTITTLHHLYAYPAEFPVQVLTLALEAAGLQEEVIHTESCFNIGATEALTTEEVLAFTKLPVRLFREIARTPDTSWLSSFPWVFEFGPRLNFDTPYSSQAVRICQRCGLGKIHRVELSHRFALNRALDPETAERFAAALYDPMLEMPYREPLKSFDHGLVRQATKVYAVRERGVEALREFERDWGIKWDEYDEALAFELSLERDENPTDAFLMIVAQLISEHSRHGYYKGKRTRNGRLLLQTLMQIIKDPLILHRSNSTVAFDCDSSAIRGGLTEMLIPEKPGEPSSWVIVTRDLDDTLTAETHNHPCRISPPAGADTGVGGRQADNYVTRRGADLGVAGAGYCTGNLCIPGHLQPWEKDGWSSRPGYPTPLQIMLGASHGTRRYGNASGEALTYGFVRTLFVVTPDGQAWGWEKPILFTVGAGVMNHEDVAPVEPQAGMLVGYVGGPRFRLGIGGGTASSSAIGYDVDMAILLRSVQRGDALMRRCFGNFFRTCFWLGRRNPVQKSSDLGAGGLSNGPPEIVYPAGAVFDLDQVPWGDDTLSDVERVGNESQESAVMLAWPTDWPLIQAICQREHLPCAVIGTVTGDGRLVMKSRGQVIVNAPLEPMLGTERQKTFVLTPKKERRQPLSMPPEETIRESLDLVFGLLSVCSKRWTTIEGDRSVGGLVAQQQDVGPYQAPIADCSIKAASHFSLRGTAHSIGEQPLSSLISPGASVRLAAAEAILNLGGVKIIGLGDVKCSLNAMLATKLPGEGIWLEEAMQALRQFLAEFQGCEPDGGKDSSAMFDLRVNPDGQLQEVRAPREIVISTNAPVPDITVKVTPDLKEAGRELLWLECNPHQHRLGGSALAQGHGQIGDECPDVKAADLKHLFEAAQELVDLGLISAYHDTAGDGSLVTALEMAFAANLGLDLDFRSQHEARATLFAQEPGAIVECVRIDAVQEVLHRHGVTAQTIGHSLSTPEIKVSVNGSIVLDEQMVDLRAKWEELSSIIDKMKANSACVDAESRARRKMLTSPPYKLTFTPKPTPTAILTAKSKIRIAMLREEGTRGEPEMAAAFYDGGFDPVDVATDDLERGKITLHGFRGRVLPGGWSFRDVFGAGQGWAAVMKGPALADQYLEFCSRPDTFTFGVCNGAQVDASLGLTLGHLFPEEKLPWFTENVSGRFECRFVTLGFRKSPAIMLRGMEGSIFGALVAHKEGRLTFPDPEVLQFVLTNDLAPIFYVGPDGEPTEEYPFNPNGSPGGITALCSPDGRKFFMMPHAVDRGFRMWQGAYVSSEWTWLEVSPYLQMVQNARTWCEQW